MSLKVIAGEYGSRVLNSLRGVGTRPLLGKVKAAIFNVLDGQVSDALVWDLFAGTGATGIEALSRGARRVVLVEKNNPALEVLRGNLEMLGESAEERGFVLRGDGWDPPIAVEFDGGDAAGKAPDLIFVDPPYASVVEDPVKSIYCALQLVTCLASGGCLVFHFEPGTIDEDDIDDDVTVEFRLWGTSAIAFMWRADEAPERVRHRPARTVSDL